MSKHIFIIGVVVSSLGKGITSASLALWLKNRGYRVAMQKLDPYLNVDPGTMSPYQHGEFFVTNDGPETDLDLGHYERFVGIECTRASNYTSGLIYSNVIAREREGGYLGGTVQVIPHITDEIKKAIYSAAGEVIDIVITEIGGTVGDIESLPFLEAARQFKFEAGSNNAIFIHLTLLPYIRAAGELKTKPSQQSADNAIPCKGGVFVSLRDVDKQAALPLIKELVEYSFDLYATRGTATMLYNHGVRCYAVYRISLGRPNLLELLQEGKFQWIINTPSLGAASMVDEIRMRSGAVTAGCPITTTLSAFTAAIEGLNTAFDLGRMTVCSLQEYHRHLVN